MLIKRDHAVNTKAIVNRMYQPLHKRTQQKIKKLKLKSFP